MKPSNHITMNKEQQDLAWACLPKEVREEIKKDYDSHPLVYHPYFNEGYEEALKIYFGNHNLTSNTEPPELLYVERENVIGYYKDVQQAIGEENGDTKIEMKGREYALLYLFGNKCLPDKEPSVQGEPKFKVGDKVRKTGWDKDTTISRVEWHGTWETFVYQFKEQEYGFNCHKEIDLTLVSKRVKDPDFSIGDKVQLKFDWCRLLKGTSLTIKGIPTIDRDDTFMYSFEETDEYIRETMLKPYTEQKFKVGDKVRVIDIEAYVDEITEIIAVDKSDPIATYKLDLLDDEGGGIWCGGNAIEPYTEPSNVSDNETMNETKDNMEEKELDIYELLESCGDVEQIYSVIHDADVDFKLSNRYIEFLGLSYYSNGTMYDAASRCMLYPSRALYEKYPLDAYSAWMEWKSERTRKRWRAKQGETYWYIGRRFKECTADANSDFDSTNYKNGNMFRTEEEAKQAAEALKECLMKFHEKKVIEI